MTPSMSPMPSELITLIVGENQEGGGIVIVGDSFNYGDSITFTPPYPITNYYPASLLFYIDGVLVGILTVWQQYLTSPVLITLNIAGSIYTVYSNNGVYQNAPIIGFRFDLLNSSLREYINPNFLT